MRGKLNSQFATVGFKFNGNRGEAGLPVSFPVGPRLHPLIGFEQRCLFQERYRGGVVTLPLNHVLIPCEPAWSGMRRIGRGRA